MQVTYKSHYVHLLADIAIVLHKDRVHSCRSLFMHVKKPETRVEVAERVSDLPVKDAQSINLRSPLYLDSVIQSDNDQYQKEDHASTPHPQHLLPPLPPACLCRRPISISSCRLFIRRRCSSSHHLGRVRSRHFTFSTYKLCDQSLRWWQCCWIIPVLAWRCESGWCFCGWQCCQWCCGAAYLGTRCCQWVVSAVSETSSYCGIAENVYTMLKNNNNSFLQIVSTSATGGQIINYSSRFTLTSLTGSLPATLITSISSLPAGTTAGPASSSNNANADSSNAATYANSYAVPYTLQTGPTRYAPMQPHPGTQITKTGTPTPLFPTSAATVASTFLPPAGSSNGGEWATTVTQSGTFSVSSMENQVCLFRVVHSSTFCGVRFSIEGGERRNMCRLLPVHWAIFVGVTERLKC